MLNLPLPRRLAGAGRPRSAALAIAQPVDYALIWVVCGLLSLGVVMVYSASIALPDSARYAHFAPTHYLVRHAVAIAFSVLIALAAAAVPVRQWQRLAPWLFLLGLIALMLVLVPGIGRRVLGARRWFSFAGLSIQPSEFMKLFVVLYVADYTVRKQAWMQSVRKGFLPMGAAVLLVGLLLLLEPDLGAFIVICAVAMALLFLGGIDGRLFAGLVGVATASFVALIAFSPWRRERMFAYLDPFDKTHALGKGYQLSHSLIAFGRGEFTGVGLGGSVEKLSYLPEPHTDFLLAVIGEELGLVGVLVVVLAFLWLTRRGFEIGRQAIALERTFAGLVAKGIAIWIGFQAFINMGVNTGLLPTKGLTLPLMSYGGTGILVNCIAIAVLVRIDYESRRLMRGGRA